MKKKIAGLLIVVLALSVWAGVSMGGDLLCTSTCESQYTSCQQACPVNDSGQCRAKCDEQQKACMAACE